MKHRLTLVILLLLAALPLGFAGAQASDDAELVWIDCPFPMPPGEVEDETLICGVIVVPEDRTNPNSPEIEIAFTILFATSETTYRFDPVIYLMGGPGGSAVFEVAGWTESAFRTERDVILVDQRGTGYSYPRLACDDFLFDLDLDPDDPDFDAASEDAVRECAAYFRSLGFDLSQYNTVNNAHDIADMMAIFIEAGFFTDYNLFGVSYGTRLALEIMRNHPEHVRTVIIDAVYPTNVAAYNELAVNTYRLLNHIFDDCAADSACNAAFPDLRTRFFGLIDRLNMGPADLGDFGLLSGDDLIGEIFSLSYNSMVVPYLPLMIDGIDRGDYRTLFAIWEGEIFPYEDMGEYTLVDEFVDEFFDVLFEMDDDTKFDFADELDAMFTPDPDTIRAVIREYVGVNTLLNNIAERLTDAEIVQGYLIVLQDDLSDSDGMFNSVECFEEIPFNSIEEAEALALSAGLPEVVIEYDLFNLTQAFNSCRLWDVAVGPPDFKEPVVSDIPTLVVSGMYDPITPPAWGAVAAQTLSNSFVYDFANIGHGAVDLPSLPCGTTVALSFLNSPNAEPDAACVAEQRVEFVTSFD
ncbi:MAG: alpha/beta fold hydrolase [Anaerolineaceae bacterium]|nr:MAG: alpha/beta fold hydrolase [Anaerolineaceae bacterium]